MAGSQPVCVQLGPVMRSVLRSPCQQKRREALQLRRRYRAVLAQADGDTLLAASEAASLVSKFVDLVATASPAPLQPAVNVLGMDIASTVALQPTYPGLARLAVRCPAPHKIRCNRDNAMRCHCSPRPVCLAWITQAQLGAEVFGPEQALRCISLSKRNRRKRNFAVRCRWSTPQRGAPKRYSIARLQEPSKAWPGGQLALHF